MNGLAYIKGLEDRRKGLRGEGVPTSSQGKRGLHWDTTGGEQGLCPFRGNVFTENREMTSIGAICTSTCHTKQLNPWPNSSASHVVIHSWLSACQGRWGHLKATRTLVDARQAWVETDCSSFSSIKHTCCWCIDVSNRWWWKVCLETVRV